MEFEEMKKIWDSQNNEPLYAINEKALHNRILSKKRQAHHITNISELLCIGVYFFTGCFVLAMNFSRQDANIFMYILSAWMLASALYVLVRRIHRLNGNNRFDRSVQGDLAHAISVATYQVSFSHLMRWNILPIGIFILAGIWDSKKSLGFAVGILIFFILTWYASGWEHRIYKNRKRELEILQDKLKNGDPGNRPS
jgi:uncharacterized membrane protein HdeD (DUF308 family)